MKKISAIILLLACSVVAWGQSDLLHPFGIKSGIMKTVTMKGDTKIGENTLWFDDYGRLQKGLTLTFMGEEFGTFSVTTYIKDKQCWFVNDNGEVQQQEGRPEYVFSLLTPEQQKEIKFKDLGMEEYKGKQCHKYYYEQKQLVKSKITAWVWEGLMVRQHIKQTFSETLVELEEIQEVPVPASTFEVPASK